MDPPLFEPVTRENVSTKLVRFLRLITVEPLLLFFMMASFAQMGIFQDLIYLKVCLNHGYDNCSSQLQNKTDIVQAESSKWILYTNVAFTVPAVFSSLYLGSWCNYYGLKIPILLPAVGAVISDAINIYLSINANTHVAYLLISQFVSGFFGGAVCVIMASFNYLTIIVQMESRTSRFAVLESMISFGGTFGPLISGQVFKLTSHAAVFGLLLGLHLFCLVYIVIRIKNLRKPMIEGENEQIENNPVNFSAIFNIRHCVETLTVFFRKRDGNVRFYLVLLMISAFLVMTTTAGELDVSLLFVKDDPLNWDYTKYSLYSTLKHILTAVSLMVGVPFLRKVFQLRDTTIALVGIIDRLFMLLFIAFSTTSALMFSVPVVGMLISWTMPSIRTMISKLTHVSEHGKLFAVVAAFEQICFLLGSLIFNGFYKMARHFFHGSIFLFCATFLLIPIGFISWIHVEFKRNEGATLLEETEDEVSINEQNIRIDEDSLQKI